MALHFYNHSISKCVYIVFTVEDAQTSNKNFMRNEGKLLLPKHSLFMSNGDNKKAAVLGASILCIYGSSKTI